MPSCQVYGNKPDTGPGQLSAQAAMDDVNQAHPAWVVAMNWTADKTTYTSNAAGVTGDDLEQAFSPHFPGYNVVGHD